MPRLRTIRGFDYTKAEPVAMTSKAWQEILTKYPRQKRIAGDLHLYDSRGVLSFELYDKAKQ